MNNKNIRIAIESAQYGARSGHPLKSFWVGPLTPEAREGILSALYRYGCDPVYGSPTYLFYVGRRLYGCHYKVSFGFELCEVLVEAFTDGKLWRLPCELIDRRPRRARPSTAASRQVGGAHYTSLGIQPAEYCHKNNLGYCESGAIKYISRYKDKNGKHDLEKAIHLLELLIELEYGDDNDT